MKNEKEKIRKLVEEGLNNSEIAEIINCHRTTVTKKMKKYGIERPERDKVCLICKSETTSRRKRCDACNTKIRRYRAKKAGVEYLGCKCNRCGWSGDLSGFDFHHIDGKDFNLGAAKMANTKWSEIKKELDKCELLCALCHRIEHSDYDNEVFLEIANENSEDLIFKE